MRSSIFVATVSCCLAVASSAAAQARPGTDDAKTVAEVLFYTARGMLEAGKVSQACEKLAESYRLDATPGTLLNLAVCHEKEGKIGRAWGEFREAIADAQKTGRTDREELAREHVKAIEPELPMLTIAVPQGSRVRGVQVFRNGSELSEAAWETPIPADPGVVKIELRAPGYYTSTKEITMARRQHMSVTLDPLRPLPVVVPPEPFLTARRTTGLIVGGTGLVALGVGAVFGVMTMNDVKASNAECPIQDGERRCTAEGAAAMNQANVHGWVSTLSFVAGGVATGVGAYLVFSHGGTEERPAEGPASTQASSASQRRPPTILSYGITPTVGGARAMLSGQF
jgi:hypothetical protein